MRRLKNGAFTQGLAQQKEELCLTVWRTAKLGDFFEAMEEMKEIALLFRLQI